MTARVAILTGGGDVPGLNMCLKSLVFRLIDLGYEPIGVRKGWEGLINYNRGDTRTYSDHFMALTKSLVRTIDRTPGSFLHSSRLNPQATPAHLVPAFLRQASAREQDLTAHIQAVTHDLGYRALVVIGDDDMLFYAAHLSQLGVPIVAIPKTIHNNIRGTDYTLGFSTGLARGVAYIHELRALAASREEIVIVETFAANSGYSTLLMAYLAGVDRAIIPEVPYDPEKLAKLAMRDKRQNPSNYAVITMTDGSQVAQGKLEAPISEPTAVRSRANDTCLQAAAYLEQLTGQGVFVQPLTYLLRTGPPDGQDLFGAANFAMHAAHLVQADRFRRMTAFRQYDTWTDVGLDEVSQGVRQVDVDAWYDTEEYRPKPALIWSATEG